MRDEPLRYFEEWLKKDDEPGDSCFVWPFATLDSGYGVVKINGKQMTVHRAACERAHGPAPDGMGAAHGPCHDRACFRPKHLAWKTQKENLADRSRDGTQPGGENHHLAKLNWGQVREIRAKFATGEFLQIELARSYGLGRKTISRVVRGVSWVE